MKQGILLYDPLPIGRLGVRKTDQEVIIANDYSCFAQMLEEYISYGAIKIAIPLSAPEIKTIDQMPLLLKRRVLIVDDTSERETLHRVLFKLRQEFSVKIDEEQDYLEYPKSAERILIDSIDQVHDGFKKIALGFNHNIQADVNTSGLQEATRLLRTKVNNSETRLLLAELESLLNQYEKVEFTGITPPKGDTPRELMNLFDKLINDESYLEYSDTIQNISIPKDRQAALLKLREVARLIKSKSYIAEGWDFVTKILKSWTGLPIPESKIIASFFKDRQLPTFVNMEAARHHAIEMWRNSTSTNLPLRRDGVPITNDNITWLPTLDGMKIKTPYDRLGQLGTVAQLLEALQKVQHQIENERTHNMILPKAGQKKDNQADE